MSTEDSSSGVRSPEGSCQREQAQREQDQQEQDQREPGQREQDRQPSAGVFDPDVAWRLSSEVALRPESFGALAYHFGNRKLSFLKTPRLVEVVRELAEHPTARDAVRSLPDDQRESYLKALASLARTQMIVPA